MVSDLSIQQFPANNAMDVASPVTNGDMSTETSIGFSNGAWKDMRDYEGAYVTITGNDVSTGETLSGLSVLASENAKGRGHGNEAVIDAVGDPTKADGTDQTVDLEITAEQIAQAESDNDYDSLRYISVRAQATDAADDYGATIVRYGPRHATKDLTNFS